MNGAKQEIMHCPALAKTYFMLARMSVDINSRWLDFEEQHIGRMATVKQHILIGLANRMGDDLITHDAAIDVKILHIGLAARERRQANPTPEAQAIDCKIHVQ